MLPRPLQLEQYKSACYDNNAMLAAAHFTSICPSFTYSQTLGTFGLKIQDLGLGKIIKWESPEEATTRQHVYQPSPAQSPFVVRSTIVDSGTVRIFTWYLLNLNLPLTAISIYRDKVEKAEQIERGRGLGDLYVKDI